MSHFARIQNGVVTDVLVIEQDVLNTGNWGDPSEFIQTSYNTRGGAHLLGGTPLRKNYATVGGVYDATRDAFYEQQPYPSWTLDENTCLWKAPKPVPAGNAPYVWREDLSDWVIVQ